MYKSPLPERLVGIQCASPIGLPREVSPILSRVAELDSLAELLASHRLVTVVGTYGVGKTRLAVHYAWREHDRRETPIYFCDLTAATSSSDLVRSIASVIGLSRSRDVVPTDVGDELATHDDLLLILDNFEQLDDESASLVAQWLSASPGLRILVTSRERLRLPGEACLQLGALSTSDAVDFLLQRARRIIPDYALDPASDGAMARIVDHLEGIPLSLEMTAPWLQILSAEALHERLERGFSLTHDGRPTTRHHSSLDTAIAWSWDILSEIEKRFLKLASIFDGQFTLDDVTSVLHLPAGSPSVLTLLRRLHERSLLRTHRHPLFPRIDFSLRASVRKYALAHGPVDDDCALTARRHRAHLIALAETLHPCLDGPNSALALAELDRIRPALTALLSSSRDRIEVWHFEEPLSDHARRVISNALSRVRRGADVTSCSTPVLAEPRSSSALNPEKANAAETVSSALLVVGPHGGWFSIDGAEPSQLGRRGPIRHILMALAEAGRDAPDTPRSLEALFAAGWPGEHIAPDSMATRVYAALSTLRRLGLEKILVTRRSGWLIAPTTRIELVCE